MNKVSLPCKRAECDTLTRYITLTERQIATADSVSVWLIDNLEWKIAATPPHLNSQQQRLSEVNQIIDLTGWLQLAN